MTLPMAQCSRGTIQSRPYPARTLKVMESAGQHTKPERRQTANDYEREGVVTTSRKASDIISPSVGFHRPNPYNRGITAPQEHHLQTLLAVGHAPGQSFFTGPTVYRTISRSPLVGGILRWAGGTFPVAQK